MGFKIVWISPSLGIIMSIIASGYDFRIISTESAKLLSDPYSSYP